MLFRSWANHAPTFTAAGLQLAYYPYYRRGSADIEREGMREALATAKAGDTLLLHGCCHNPTGVDPTPAQWEEVADAAQERGWVPLVDFAYQGFGESVEADRAGVLAMAETGIEFFVASSFSKNFGLYQDRTGALTFAGSDTASTGAVFSHDRRAARQAMDRLRFAAGNFEDRSSAQGVQRQHRYVPPASHEYQYDIPNAMHHPFSHGGGGFSHSQASSVGQYGFVDDGGEKQEAAGRGAGHWGHQASLDCQRELQQQGWHEALCQEGEGAGDQRENGEAA